MINEELKTFIAKMKVAGKTDSEITAELKTAGWAETAIASVLNPPAAPTLPVESQPQLNPDLPKKKINNPAVIVIVTLITAIMAGAVGWFFIKKPYRQSMPQPMLAPPMLQPTTQPQSISGGGTNFSSAVVVPADSEATGVAWEYDWLKKNGCSDNNGYKKPAGQVLKSNNNHRYDVITAVCNDGKNIDYYFLIDNFFGKQ